MNISVLWRNGRALGRTRRTEAIVAREKAGTVSCRSRSHHDEMPTMDVPLMFSPLVLLKKGPDAPPLFITHGLGGDVSELSPIVEHLDASRPIYGVQWQGLDGVTEPHDSIDAMAQCFTDAIVALRPNGPYLLAGLSIGGLPMLEVANRLSEQGKEVALVALLDTYPHPRHWPLRCWIGSIYRRLKYRAGVVAKMPIRLAIPYFLKLCRSFLNDLRTRLGGAAKLNATNDEGAAPALWKLRVSAYQAYLQYRPRPYLGKVAFVSAGIISIFPRKPVSVWRKLIPDLEVHTIPCDHVAMIAKNAKQVADALSLSTRKALHSRERPQVETV
jgi:acetoacetyl-CoA synthetase